MKKGYSATSIISVERCLEDVLQLCKMQLCSPDVSFNYVIDGDVPPAMVGDEKCLQRILYILLSQALGFISKGTVTLDVRAKRRQGEWYEWFFRVLEMPTCWRNQVIPQRAFSMKQDLHSLGARLCFSKSAAHEVCTACQFMAEAAPVHVASLPGESLPPLSILLAEPDGEYAAMVSRMFKSLGYVCNQENDPDRVLQKLQQSHYELLVLGSALSAGSRQLIVTQLPHYCLYALRPYVLTINHADQPQTYNDLIVDETLVRPLSRQDFQLTLKAASERLRAGQQSVH